MTENQRPGFGNSRPMMFMHFVAGAMYGFLGCLFLFNPEQNFFGLQNGASMGIGAVLIIYAFFRFWKGYRVHKVNKSSE
ncbi:MAG: hypothetical protein SGJ10_08170 [Bacteroidota bacterium]|nr:hypothetical protein [Bacteroidota bacterium]